MKKLGKKISFLTKIMLVIGLLVSNLSSLSVVFAYEVPENVVIALEEDNLNIEYTEELAEDIQKVRVDVYESYTYLDSTEDKYPVVEYEFDTTEMGEDRLLELTHAKSTFSEFDGTYKVVVEIYKIFEVLSEPVNELESLENLTPEVTEELMATGTFEKEVTYKKGLELKVYNSDGNELIGASNGKYVLSEAVNEIRVDAYILPGGLAPSDEFLVGDTKYTAEEIQLLPNSYTHVFGDKLYGEYNIPVSVEVEKVAKVETSSEGDEVIEVETDVVLEEENSSDLDNEETTNNETLKYNTNINVMYGTYNGNTIELNNTLQALDMIDTYTFYGNSKNNTLYKFIDLTEEGNESVTNSMLDLYRTLEGFVNGTSIKYELLKNNEDVVKKYNDTYGVQETPEDEIVAPVSEETEEVVETVSLEDYLKEIALDETVKLVLTSDDVTVSYSLVVLADLNNDNVLDESDVVELIELVLDNVTDNKKADATGDGVVNSLDILYLTEVIKNSNWAITIPKEDATLDTELKVNAEDTLVSGDEFTLDYVLKLSTDEVSGFSGKFNYDKSALELVSVESLMDSVGNYNKDNGNFLYLGEESLSLPEIDEEPIVPVEPEEEIALLAEGEEDLEEPTVVTEDHVVVRAKFRALKSGNHTVSIKDTEYYNLNTYLNATVEDASVIVEVVKSDDNKLSYLEVAGTVIELVDDVFEYEITVKNEVTSVDLKYILSNVAANVTSTVYPEELSEGENEVIIIVTSESGIVQDYKVVVTREEAVKETTTQVHYNNYQPNYNEPEVEEPEPVAPVEPEEPKDEKDGNAFNIIIIALIVLVIGGLVYLIFKDDREDDGTNKKINKLKKDTSDFEEKPEKQVKENKNSNNKSKNKSNQKKNNNNKKKEK